ncbi:hypothetical protein EJB05_05783, partial [Eragrostis curvula]
MFRNKVLVRAAATAASSSSAPLPPFLLRQLSLPNATPIPALDLDILCCRLSRRHRLACLPQAPADVLLVYQRCQSHEADAAVAEVAAGFPGASVGEEEVLACSGELVAKAVECGLRSLMLEHGWKFLGETIYVCSSFAESEEKTDLCALNVEIRLGRNDDFEFVVSPDAFRFTTHKISDAACLETFQPRNDVVLNSNSVNVCTILPALQEGHVIGYSKILPSEQCLDKFMELCSLKHGLDTSCNYHVAVKLGYGTSLEAQWLSFPEIPAAFIVLPSSLVLQGSGLQPALKSVRPSKAMSSLQSFAKLLSAWNFFGQNQLVIKEQLLLNCTAALPTWDKAASNLTRNTAKTDNSRDQSYIVHPNLVATDQSFVLDFRTPKPPILCSLSVKSLDAKGHKITHSLDDNDYLSATSPIKYGYQSKPSVVTKSCESQVTIFKPSFSRKKSAERRKMGHSSEHFDVDNSNKSSHPDAASSLANHVSSSSASLPMPVTQEHAKLQKTSCQGGGGTEKVLQGIPEVTKETADIEKDGLSTNTINKKMKIVVTKDEVNAAAKTNAKQDLGKKESAAVKKLKTVPEVVKDRILTKVRDNSNGELSNRKVTNGRTKPLDKDSFNSTTITKAKPDIANDELISKVIDHHQRAELRLLTVADLKCFLSARKAKVGGTKEVLIQRVTELLA